MSFHKVVSTSKSNIKEKRVEGISEVGGEGLMSGDGKFLHYTSFSVPY